MSTLFDNLVSGGGSTYFDDLNAAPGGGTQPAIAGVGTLRFNGNATITGANFEASQGAGSVTIGGVSQPIVSWSASSIVIGPIARGTLRYGAQNVVVNSDSHGASPPSSQSLLPQTGWSYVDLTNPLASSGQRITSTPDLAAGDQLAWGDVLPSGSVTVAVDGSFSNTSAVGQFSVEANDGTGWGGFGVQLVANVAQFSGALAAGVSRITGSFSVQVPSTARTFSGAVHAGVATVSGVFLSFTSRSFNGILAAANAAVQGAFSVIGAVIPTNPPPSTPIPSGTAESKVAIVNRGLICLGVAAIRSFTDDSKAARLASQMYDRVRDSEIARHTWKFSLARRAVPEVVSDDPRGSYQYAYAKPVDWLQTVWIGNETLGTPGAVYDVDAADWSDEGDFILTNVAPPLPLQYVRRITDPTRYHVLFCELLGRRFAMELADALTGSTDKWRKAREEYRDTLADARRANALLNPPRGQQADSWISSRY